MMSVEYRLVWNHAPLCQLSDVQPQVYILPDSVVLLLYYLWNGILLVSKFHSNFLLNEPISGMLR